MLCRSHRRAKSCLGIVNGRKFLDPHSQPHHLSLSHRRSHRRNFPAPRPDHLSWSSTNSIHRIEAPRAGGMPPIEPRQSDTSYYPTIMDPASASPCDTLMEQYQALLEVAETISAHRDLHELFRD